MHAGFVKAIISLSKDVPCLSFNMIFPDWSNLTPLVRFLSRFTSADELHTMPSRRSKSALKTLELTYSPMPMVANMTKLFPQNEACTENVSARGPSGGVGVDSPNMLSRLPELLLPLLLPPELLW